MSGPASAAKETGPERATSGGTVEILARRVGPVEVPLPAYQTSGASGCDLVAALAEAADLEPGRRLLVPTGLALALPPGTEGQVRPRSGLAAKHGITVLNAPGTIDADYRGEVKVLLVNLGEATYRVEPGARIAQLVVAHVVQAHFTWAQDLDATGRGAGGFGSTGA